MGDTIIPVVVTNTTAPVCRIEKRAPAALFLIVCLAPYGRFLFRPNVFFSHTQGRDTKDIQWWFIGRCVFVTIQLLLLDIFSLSSSPRHRRLLVCRPPSVFSKAIAQIQFRKESSPTPYRNLDHPDGDVAFNPMQIDCGRRLCDATREFCPAGQRYLIDGA